MDTILLRFGKKAALFATLLLLAWVPAMPAAAGGDAGHFVESLADEAIKTLAPAGISRAERIDRFRKLFDESFAADGIGKWVLGRYWRQATPAEQAEYLKLFKDYIVAAYVDRFAAYTGEKLLVTSVVAEGGQHITVFSDIVSPGKPPVRLGWRIQDTDHQFKIVDLMVEGISMSTTLRADFGSVVQRDGGQISGLLGALREKTATLRTSN